MAFEFLPRLNLNDAKLHDLLTGRLVKMLTSVRSSVTSVPSAVTTWLAHSAASAPMATP